MPEAIVNGARIAYDEHGDGPPLVLVHGLGGTATDIWKYIVAELGRDFRVVAYDLRGSGRSEGTPGPYSVELLTGDLAALTDALGLGSFGLVGHSLGGAIALEYAASHSDRIQAVIGVAAVTELSQQGKEAMEARAATVEAEGMAAVAETVAMNGVAPSFREAHPEKLGALVSMLASNRPQDYAAQCRALVGMTTGQRLVRVAAPVLLVYGELDAVSSPELNRENAARLRNARLVALPDCAHIVPWERPAELLEAARSFLREHTA